ncbi:hypothetical protein IFM89_027684 [Coptis chinensis]|uniref:Protein root UVB sensitive/RUS domain-containing protein n=1 Tax=Coptis chinensis TaxID=261450 RepID=A0A835J0Y5_9MAGN|nr:hypothetical protein IFM89_027684 [Coptis chinensis]
MVLSIAYGQARPPNRFSKASRSFATLFPPTLSTIKEVFDFHSVQFEHWYRVADSIFPRYFSLLATVANIAKQVSLACYLATGSAVHRSFAEKDNLGALSAKSQTQSVCFDSLGLVLATLLNILCKNNQRLQAGLPLVIYPVFSAIDFFGIYQGLMHVQLQTLNKVSAPYTDLVFRIGFRSYWIHGF